MPNIIIASPLAKTYHSVICDLYPQHANKVEAVVIDPKADETQNQLSEAVKRSPETPFVLLADSDAQNALDLEGKEYVMEKLTLPNAIRLVRGISRDEISPSPYI